MLRLFSFIISAFAATGYSKIYSALPELPENLNYDFIIVGGGTAGSVLANRLSANPHVSVLVIEAGSTPDSNLNIEVPFFAPFLKGSTFDWNFTSVAQPSLDNRTVYYERGHVLGGSSAVNLLAFNRASNDFWDRWATLTNDSQWSWKNIEPYYMRTSRLAHPHKDLIKSAHGDGPVLVSTPGFETILNEPVIDTAKSLGGRFSFQADWNAGNFTGIGYYQSAIGDGQRSDAASAYITPIVDRSNLDILINTRVTRLIQTDTILGNPTFLEVEFGTSSSDLRTLTASAEVILSAGVFGTAQILMLSGIGPSAELQRLGIKPILDAPQVGGNLTDHPLLPNYFYINGTTFDPLISNLTARTDALAKWNATKTDRLADANAVALGFLRLPEDSPALEPFGDPSSGPLSAHIELLFADGFSAVSSLAHPTNGSYMTVLTAVVSPLSRGSVTLESKDPFIAPIIDTQLLSHPFDQAAMTQAILDTQTLLASPLLAAFNPSPYNTLEDTTAFDSLVAYARTLTVSLNHPVGTAAMSPTSAPWGVLDSNLLVKKVSGLRVVDASAFPAIPECHPQAVVYTLAEKAVALIEERWKGEYNF